jgi:serine/threonine-protein kinase
VTWWIAGALGHPVPQGAEALLLVGPVILSGGLALVAARAIGQMTAEIQRARAEVREMGSYRMVERIGRGGMGEVWRAEHRMLARPAAIKVIRPENLVAISPEKHRIVLERFRREAQDTAALTSPHTVQVHDFGLTDEGTFYYVMELLDGVDLNTVIREEGALPYERVVHLLGQACDSLAEAHALGLVHRDLKPANLMACRLGGHHDFVKVLDFGIVLRSETTDDGAITPDTPDAREAAERLTVEGNLLGTPTFMPPEMALGRRVDARADVYAIGCIAFMLLAGRPPYEASNSVEMLVRHIQHPVPRVGKLVAVPAELDALVAACMAKNVAERPADARVLRDLLRRVPVERPWTEERAAEWWTLRAKKGAKEPAAA